MAIMEQEVAEPQPEPQAITMRSVLIGVVLGVIGSVILGWWLKPPF